jgi:hypothetical protein
MLISKLWLLHFRKICAPPLSGRHLTSVARLISVTISVTKPSNFPMPVIIEHFCVALVTKHSPPTQWPQILPLLVFQVVHLIVSICACPSKLTHLILPDLITRTISGESKSWSSSKNRNKWINIKTNPTHNMEKTEHNLRRFIPQEWAAPQHIFKQAHTVMGILYMWWCGHSSSTFVKGLDIPAT